MLALVCFDYFCFAIILIFYLVSALGTVPLGTSSITQGGAFSFLLLVFLYPCYFFCFTSDWVHLLFYLYYFCFTLSFIFYLVFVTQSSFSAPIQGQSPMLVYLHSYQLVASDTSTSNGTVNFTAFSIHFFSRCFACSLSFSFTSSISSSCT